MIVHLSTGSSRTNSTHKGQAESEETSPTTSRTNSKRVNSWDRPQGPNLNFPRLDFLGTALYFQKYHALSLWDCHMTLVPSNGRGFNGRAEQRFPATDKWWRFSNLCSIFSIVWCREESRNTPLDFRKENSRHYFMISARQNVSACLFSREYWSRFRGRFDGRFGSIIQPCLSLIHC